MVFHLIPHFEAHSIYLLIAKGLKLDNWKDTLCAQYQCYIIAKTAHIHAFTKIRRLCNHVQSAESQGIGYGLALLQPQLSSLQ